jgi:hypothetical protein
LNAAQINPRLPINPQSRTVKSLMPPVYFGPERPPIQTFVCPPEEKGTNPLDFFVRVMTGTKPEDVPKNADEKEAFYESLHEKYVNDRTISDPQVSERLSEILQKAGSPETWTSLVRRPRINGQSSTEFRKTPTEMRSWVMGHELRMRKDHFLWGCLAIGEDTWMYAYHSISVYKDGRLIGESPGGGGKIDLQDVHRILTAWSKELEVEGGKYWDMINDQEV